ncbi:unnamed protein product [Mytilus coruscus]|uniref:KY-like immunoglobulin-like domain-containing protein n=1 Tax=Mytilus coruscus TaxID=42192 RepID=A0A6J8C291_MYTCO|nr:unnamed protein product [Mytilus coruscus]
MNDNLKESYEWQLLQTPVSIDDFSKKIKLTYQAMTWKIYPKSHKQGIINITTPSDIILLDTEEQLLTVKAIFLNMNNGNFEETGCVFARKETKSELHITVRPKSFGKYLLQLYGQTDKNTNKVIMLMEYIIKSLCIFDLRPFPQVSELWGIKPEAYDCGLSKINDIPILHKVKRETEIRLQTTRQIHALVHLHAAKNNLIGDEGYVLAESDENALVLKVRSPSNDYYKLTLYLKTVLNPNENNEYHAMATFLINCTEPLVPCIPFPKTFPKTVEYYCKIIEPVYKRIPACTRIRFRMKSNKLQIANVSWKKMDKIGDEWIVDIFSPGAGEVVQINGNVTQDGKCWCLFEYETVEDSNEIMKSMQSRFMKPDEQYIGKTKDVNNLNKKHPLESCGLRTDIPSVNDPRTKYAKQWGIKPKSHTCSTIKIEDEVEITAEDSMDRLVFTVNFFLETSEFVNIDEYVFLRKESPKELKVTIRPPSSGTYILRLYGHIDKDSQTHELLLSYTIISSMEGGLVVKPYPTHNGLWGILSEAFTHGLHKENAYNISTFHSCKRNLEICFRTEQKVYSTSKLEPVNNTLLDGHHYTILESTEDYLKVKINFPFEDYYKLTLWFKRSTKETDDCRYSEMANFLIDCREPNRPCMPFPITSSYTQKFSCKLIEPMSGFLPEQSIIKFRIKSPIVKTFLLAGEKMERINDEYITIVTTPSKGNEFHLSGKTEDEEKYWVLFQYEIVSKSGKRNNETYIANTILESKEWDLMCNYNQERKVPVTNYAKEIGIQPLSHKGEFINVHEFVDIKISDIKNCLDNCNATLSRLSNTTDIRTENIFIRKEKTREIAVAIIPPPPGLYCLKIYGQGGSKPKECLPLLLQYTVKSDGVDEDRPFPKNDGLWGFLSDADNYGFQNTGAHLVPVMYKVKGEATLYFPTYQNINRSVKLTSEHNMPDGSNCTLIESDNHCFNITLRLPFTGYYKLTIFSETDSKHHKTGTFLIDCIEPANPCLPFPTTFASTQYYNCILIEPLNGTLPANSSVTCKFRSSIVFSAVVNGSMMTKEGNEWVLTTTTPSTGEAFDIFGKSSDRDTFSVLFRYVIR